LIAPPVYIVFVDESPITAQLATFEIAKTIGE
jgi:hypothetical protein